MKLIATDIHQLNDNTVDYAHSIPLDSEGNGTKFAFYEALTLIA